MTAPFQGTRLNVPSGVIVPYHGSGDSIPPGWAFCDGNNGTPDLRNRFVRSISDSQEEPGNTGGQNRQQLSLKETPNHEHDGWVDDYPGEHEHSGWSPYHVASGSAYTDSFAGDGRTVTTENTGGHRHDIETFDVGAGEDFDNRPSYYTMTFIQRL